MNQFSGIIKRILIFLVIYLGVSMLFSIPSVNNAHLGFYRGMGKATLNMVFPNGYIDVVPYQGEPMNKWDTTYLIYPEDKYPQSIYKTRYRRSVPPGLLMHKGVREMLLIPSILLFILFMVTPLPWVKRILFAFIGILILYFIGAMHVSYHVELNLAGGEFSSDSLYKLMISLFGGRMTDEHFNIIAILIWALFSFSSGLHKKFLTE